MTVRISAEGLRITAERERKGNISIARLVELEDHSTLKVDMRKDD